LINVAETQEGFVLSEDLTLEENLETKSYSLGLVKNYLQDLHKIPLLLPAEEIKLARTYRHSRTEESLEARNKLIQANLRLVVSLAKKYSNSRFELIELIQEGNLGLLKAVDKYDPELGYRFSTYATWWIRQSILAGISERSRLIRIPTSMQELFSKIRKTREYLLKILGREATLYELGQVLELEPKKLEKLQLLEDQQDQLISLDAYCSSDDNNEVSLLDTICDELTFSLEQKTDQAILHQFLNNAIANLLNEREASIVRLHYGFNDECLSMTLTELANKFEVSLERIRQIELKALSKLKACISLQFGNYANLVF
jgi:RNA polymerase primary sigma factor